MNPLIIKQTIHRMNYDGQSDLEYLAKSISSESQNELIDQFLDFTEKLVDEGQISKFELERLIEVQLTVLGLLTNLGHEDMRYAYHIDTWEKDKCWRVQILVSTHMTGLDTYLRNHPLCEHYTIYLGGERGILPKIKVCNGELVITAVLDKKPEYWR